MRVLKPTMLFALCLAAPLAAQDKSQLCNDLLHRPMKVGQWARFAWTGGHADGSTLRLAVVGTESVGGTAYYWYELSFDDPRRGEKGKTILQMLVPGLAYEAGSVHGLVMKTGGQPAMRMPEQMVQLMGSHMGENPAAEVARRCQDMVVVGWEPVTVPAGAFRALHIESSNGDTEAWIQPDLYFGLLRAVMKDGNTIELTGRGTDATSSITETPRELPH